MLVVCPRSARLAPLDPAHRAAPWSTPGLQGDRHRPGDAVAAARLRRGAQRGPAAVRRGRLRSRAPRTGTRLEPDGRSRGVRAPPPFGLSLPRAFPASEPCVRGGPSKARATVTPLPDAAVNLHSFTRVRRAFRGLLLLFWELHGFSLCSLFL